MADHFSGRVIRKRVSPGSKSDRQAVVLVSDKGEFVLRRKGGHPFTDDILDQLVGKQIDGEGHLHGYTFIMSNWKEI